MKGFVATAALAAFVAAQDLPACGTLCINNMIGIMQAAPYNCPNNATCFCCKPDFGFGVRDCSNKACGDANIAKSVIDYAATYCASALPTQSTGVCTSFSGAGLTGTATSTLAIQTLATGVSGSGTTQPATATSGAAPGSFLAVGTPIANAASGYSIAGTTITAGGAPATTNGVVYTVASNGDVIATGASVTTTYFSSAIVSNAAAAVSNSASALASSTSGAAAASASGSGASGATTNTAASTTAAAASSSTTSRGGAAMVTAAPAMVGAAALALLAL